jgi:hypothetical protein
MGIPVETGALVTTIVAALSSLMIDQIKAVRSVHWAMRAIVVAAAATLLYVCSAFLTDAISDTFEERIQGLWLETFNEPPNENQKYSIAFIEYKKSSDQINSGGFGYTATGELVSEWTCDAFVPNPRNNQCLLTYTGDIYGVAHDISGQGLMRFDPPGWIKGTGPFQNGSGFFHEAYTQHQKVPYKLSRITSDLCFDVLGKESMEQRDYPEFIRRYHEHEKVRSE